MRDVTANVALRIGAIYVIAACSIGVSSVW